MQVWGGRPRPPGPLNSSIRACHDQLAVLPPGHEVCLYRALPDVLALFFQAVIRPQHMSVDSCEKMLSCRGKGLAGEGARATRVWESRSSPA
jgi:hypothetical protein